MENSMSAVPSQPIPWNISHGIPMAIPFPWTVAYAGFLKGGGGGRKFRKFENNKDQNENFPVQNLVRFPAQN